MNNPVSRAKAIAGSWPATAILLRLTYWMRKTKIRHGPHMWVVMSREEWLEETGCTVDEHKNAVSRLKALDIIIVETHLMRGRTRSFMRLADGVLEYVESGAAWGSMAPAGEGSTTPTDGGLATPTYIEPSVLKEVKKEDKEVSGEATLAEGFGAKIEKGSKTMKVSDVMNAVAAKKASKVLHKPDTVKQLGYIWKGTVSEVYGTPMVNLTNKHLGQLGHFKNACPDGTAVAVLTWVLSNWIEFVKTVETHAGIKHTPSQPDVGFLLKYVQVAVSVAETTKGTQKTTLAHETPSPAVQSVSLHDEDEDEDDPPIKSKEELMALINAGAKSGG